MRLYEATLLAPPYRLPSLTAYPRWGRGIRSGSVATRHWLNAGFEGTAATLEYSLFGNEKAIVKQLTKIAGQASFFKSRRRFRAAVKGASG